MTKIILSMDDEANICIVFYLMASLTMYLYLPCSDVQ